MDEFQILRCLWKSLNKMLQSIVLEFLKTKKNQTQKRPPKVFESHVCQLRTQFHPI